ncbi:WbqC family protein [Candidatus Marinarcus aquaticus]|uniref:WbqC family protein n=1 Tax=Candidatus Marinarcus aquaticus TaxID=2044504 RepID=A0A4Q0XS35_9BACT|nr:WbqC family protein [Candidatus Marinarcus aquaticus]RXJ55390.1 hypothetical protein CRV04_09805 [Candidatus Marinarcus aquaticus]
MNVAILQPSYIPWIGYFEQIANVEKFVFYDDVQYTKNDWRNRNRIKTPQGALWLTIPVSYKYKELINEVTAIPGWQKKHLKTIINYYHKAKYFDEIFPLFEKVILNEKKFLSEICIDIIKTISSYLEFKTKFYRSSEMNISGDKNERLINICQELNAQLYYSGQSANSYINVKKFQEKGIEVKFQNFNCVPYEQFYGEFIPYLSVLDLLFHCGKESRNIIQKGVYGI